MKNLPVIVLIFSFSVVFGAIAHAQCVIDPIRVDQIEGQVLFGFQGQYRVLDKATVRLLDHNDTNRVIASSTTDRNGHFLIVPAKPGPYVFSAHSEALIPAFVDIDLYESRKRKDKKQILVVLAADATKECGGASIELKSKAEIDEIVGSAKR